MTTPTMTASPEEVAPVLEVKNVSVSYGQHRALTDISLDIRPSEIVVILGANGAGKSSLLKAVGGMVPVLEGGSVRMDRTELTALATHRIVDTGVALVPEGRGVFADLTVAENLSLGALPARARAFESENLKRVTALFPRLAERMRQLVRTMSGGEQQMVAMGRALMSNPKILLLDEPSLGLSPLMFKELFAALVKVREMGVGVLLVEQNAKRSLAIADRGYLMESGRIVGQGSATELRFDPAVQRAYLGAGAH